ncbi:hypothetical protein FH972_022831 [Carpinus fangiana]|uniref:Uncharacterized protein n=1 Tax=Carpinus fangiana TaxID=176857 RepID=A0A5N6KTX3_9ROSI|nr:hypothetical protein FH972_022831 [Carpinus fangiana]
MTQVMSVLWSREARFREELATEIQCGVGILHHDERGPVYIDLNAEQSYQMPHDDARTETASCQLAHRDATPTLACRPPVRARTAGSGGEAKGSRRLTKLPLEKGQCPALAGPRRTTVGSLDGEKTAPFSNPQMGRQEIHTNAAAFLEVGGGATRRADLHDKVPAPGAKAYKAYHTRQDVCMTSPQGGQEDLFYSLANADSAQDRSGGKQRSTRHWAPADSPQARGNPPRSVAPASTARNQSNWDSNGNVPASSPITPAPASAYERPLTRSGSQRTSKTSHHSRFASADWAARFGRPTAPSRQPSDNTTVQTPTASDQFGYRRPSLANAFTPTNTAPAYRTAQTPHDTNNRASSPLRAHPDDADSVVSTTAPSTVWDELGELKTRIRNLELTGSRRRPPPVTTQSYTDYNERPHTGTTQTTDLTSPNPSHLIHISPKQNRQIQTEELHPLLREALGKARSRLEPNTYRFLESSVFDSLELASMARGLDAGVGDTMSVATGTTSGGGTAERRIRRKADNVCRSLTELCIALCEGKSPASNGQPVRPQSRDQLPGRPGSRDQLVMRPSSRDTLNERQAFVNGSSPLTLAELRRSRTERLDGAARPSPRLASRLESRRSSAVDITESGAGSAYERQPVRRLSNVTASNAGDSTVDNDFTLRGPTRAMTEIHTRERLSRQLSNGHRYDLQAGSSNGVSPSIRERLLANRSNNSLNSPSSERGLVPDSSFLASPTSEAPAERGTFDQSFQSFNGGRRPSSSRRAPPSAAANLAERLEAKRQQRVASAGQLAGIGQAMRRRAKSGISARDRMWWSIRPSLDQHLHSHYLAAPAR